MGLPAVLEQFDSYQIAEAKKNLNNRFWRLNHLYKIVNKDGELVTFKMNEAQIKAYKSLHTRMLILKARQAGFSTFIQIFMLDYCLFNSNIFGAVVAHGLKEASNIFQSKILTAYDNLPDFVKLLNPVESKTRLSIKFQNGSKIEVGTSLRSGTPHILHVSEMAKICKKYPVRAQELVSGTLESVPKYGMTVIESTGEGKEGKFYDYSENARLLSLTGRKLNPLEYKFVFVAWHEISEYRLNEVERKHIVVNERLKKYFTMLDTKYGIDLDDAQKAWYTVKEKDLGDLMKQEHPSHPGEPFEVSKEGTIFRHQFEYIYEEQRITKVPYNRSLRVNTAWDLGRDDATAIWFYQISGRECHLIDFYKSEQSNFIHYANVIKEKGETYNYSTHYAPHDIGVKEYMQEHEHSRLKIAKDKYGINFTPVSRVSNKIDSIEAARRALSVCVFDEKKCEQGILDLENYKWKWDQMNGVWTDTPSKANGADHTADALQCMAMGDPFFTGGRLKFDPPPQQTNSFVRSRGI